MAADQRPRLGYLRGKICVISHVTHIERVEELG